MFEFGQDFSYLLINGSPPSNLLQQALIRAQKWPFEQEGNFPSAFEPVTQLQQSGANMHEFYRLLEIFFNCVLRARDKFEAPQEGIGASSRIVWPPTSQAIPQPALSAPGSLSTLPPPPSVPLSRKSVPTDEKCRDQAEETVNQREFTTPALNSLIEMTLSKTYQLGGANESVKGKSGQKHINGVPMTGELNSEDGLSSRTPKRRKTRTTFTSFQLAELEVYFSKQKYLTPADRDQIAGELGLSSTQVITWFQNRRAKKKRECAELERDLMAAKRSCEKGSAFSLDAVHSSQVASLPASSTATASTTAEEAVAAATAVHPPFSPASCSSSSSSSASAPVSASASLTEAPTVSAPPGKPDFSIPSLTAPDSSRRRNPKSIWRPVCLEDIGRE